MFYNSYYGSTMEEAKMMPFKFTDPESITISDLKEKATGRIGFTGTIDIIKDEQHLSLTLFPEVLNIYYNKEDVVSEFFDKSVELRGSST